jgi:hypothetical protein
MATDLEHGSCGSNRESWFYSTEILVPWLAFAVRWSMRSSITSRMAFRNSTRELTLLGCWSAGALRARRGSGAEMAEEFAAEAA